MTRRLSTSDAQLRSLERRALESGDPDDQAALLLQRVRVGALDRLRLELAVQCGHEPARRAAGAAAGRSFADLPPGALALLLEVLADLAAQQPRSVRLSMALKEAALELVRSDRSSTARAELLEAVAAAIARAKRLGRRPRSANEAGAGWIFAAALELAEALLSGRTPTPATVQSLDDALRTTRYGVTVVAPALVG